MLIPRRSLAPLAVLGAALTLGAGAAQAAPENLISNPTLLTNSEGFTFEPGRGDPATGTWRARGYKDAGSLTVTFPAGGAGGPAWYSPATAVAPETEYLVSVRSKSTVETELLAEISTSFGSTIYKRLAVLPASSTWDDARALFTTPAGATSVRIYQEIAQPGTLQTDRYELRLTETPDLSTGIPNGSLEQADDLNPAAPLSFIPVNAMGEAATLKWVARDGGKAVKVRVTEKPSSGRYAYWQFPETELAHGGYYEFQTDYKASTSSRAFVEFQRADGTYRSIALKVVPATKGEWATYRERFYVPETAERLHIIHVPVDVGTLQTDDYRLAPATAEGFERPLVSLTFDDGWASQRDAASPALASHGMKGSFYITTGFLDDADGEFMTRADVQALATAGHEVGAHSINHDEMTTLDAATQRAELRVPRTELRALTGQPVAGFASPFGDYNGPMLTRIASAGYTYHRSIDEGYIEKETFDPMRLPSYLMLSDTSQEELERHLERAATSRSWLILTWHGIDESGELFSQSPAQLDAALAQIEASGIATPTVASGLTETSSQMTATPQTPASTSDSAPSVVRQDPLLGG